MVPATPMTLLLLAGCVNIALSQLRTPPKCMLSHRSEDGEMVTVDVYKLYLPPSMYYSVPSAVNTDHEFVFNICGSLDKSLHHGAGYPAVIKRKKVNYTQHLPEVLGYWIPPTNGETYKDGEFKYQNNGAQNPLDTAVEFNLYGPDLSASGGVTFNATILLTCAMSFNYFPRNRRNLETSTSVVIEWDTPYACGVLPAAEIEPDSLDEAAIYIAIIVPPLILIYCVVGVIYNHVKGVQGFNKIPQSELWFSLPFLVRDGCIYSREIVLSKILRRGSSDWGYDNGRYELLNPPESSTPV